MKELLFATSNRNKIKRFNNYFRSLELKVVGPESLGLRLRVLEDGETPKENAEKKALAYYKETGRPCFAVDYGLFIDRFPEDEQPGLNVRRIRDDDSEVTDEELLEYFVQKLEEVGGESEGTWISAITLATSNGTYSNSFFAKTLLTAKRSNVLTKGEPLNSLQIDPNSGKYYSELTEEEWLELRDETEKGYVRFMKNHVSHI